MKAVMFKEESVNDCGEAIGPAIVVELDENARPILEARPFDPDHKPRPWITRDKARMVAREHGLKVIEF